MHDLAYNNIPGAQTRTRWQWLIQPPAPVWAPLLLMKKCSAMHKMCQIPHPIDASVPWAPLLDLATLTIARLSPQCWTQIGTMHALLTHWTLADYLAHSKWPIPVLSAQLFRHNSPRSKFSDVFWPKAVSIRSLQFLYSDTTRRTLQKGTNNAST